MVACLPPFFPFSSFLPFLLRLSSHPPLYFSCVRSTNAGQIIPSVFLIPLCPSSEPLWITNPPPQSLSCTWLQTSHTHHALSAALYTPSAHCSLCMFTERLMNFWAHPELVTCRLKKTNCSVCVCVCVCTRPGVTDGGGTERVWIDNIQQKCARNLRDSQILSASSVRQHHWAQKMKRKFAERPPIHKVGQQ